MGGREAMLAECRSQLGYQERADGTTKYGDWFAGLVGDGAYRAGNWCAMGLLWSAHQAGQLAAVGGAHRDWAWVPSWMEWFQDNGRFRQRPAPGRIVFFDWEGNGVPNHVGIVERAGGGGVHTIEFNTDDACMRRIRPSGLILGYGNPAYADIPAPALSDDSCWVG